MSRNPAGNPAALTRGDPPAAPPARDQEPSVTSRPARKPRRLRHPLIWVAAVITILIVIWLIAGPGAAFGVVILAIAVKCGAAPSPADRRRRPTPPQVTDHDGLPQVPSRAAASGTATGTTRSAVKPGPVQPPRPAGGHQPPGGGRRRRITSGSE